MSKKKKHGKKAVTKKKKPAKKQMVKVQKKLAEDDFWNDEPEPVSDPYSDDESEDEHHTVLGADN